MKRFGTIKTIIIFVVLLIFASGCANSFGNLIGGTRTNNGDPIPDLNSGGKGVVVKWLDEMPPEKVKRGVEFQLGVGLSNVGFENIDEGVLKTWGCKKLEITGGTPHTETFSLDGKSVNNIIGGMAQKFMRAKGNDVDDKCYIHAQVCYPYKTHVSETICVDPNPYSSSIGKPCTYKSPISPSGQGGPVNIDRIEYAISKNEESNVEFTFNFYPKNVGSGRIINSNDWKLGCENSNNVDILKKIDAIKISARLGQSALSCTPAVLYLNKETDLKNRKYFSCKGTISKDRNAYSTILTADLKYGYIDGKDVNIKIEGKKDNPFPTQSSSCSEDHCFNSEWGVCNEVYGGVDTSKVCDDKSKLCCKNSQPVCVTEEKGTCKSECSGEETYIAYKCPGTSKCCVSSK